MSYYDYQEGRTDGLAAGSAERYRIRKDLEAANMMMTVKNEAINILGRQAESYRSERDTARRERNEFIQKFDDARATIAALQQSLDEATAKINSNTPDTFINYPVKQRTFAPKPDTIKLGDLVRYRGGVNHYIVERIFPVEPGSLYPDNPKLMLRHIGTKAVYYGRPKNLVKLS